MSSFPIDSQANLQKNLLPALFMQDQSQGPSGSLSQVLSQSTDSAAPPSLRSLPAHLADIIHQQGNFIKEQKETFQEQLSLQKRKFTELFEEQEENFQKQAAEQRESFKEFLKEQSKQQNKDFREQLEKQNKDVEQLTKENRSLLRDTKNLQQNQGKLIKAHNALANAHNVLSKKCDELSEKCEQMEDSLAWSRRENEEQTKLLAAAKKENRSLSMQNRLLQRSLARERTVRRQLLADPFALFPWNSTAGSPEEKKQSSRAEEQAIIINSMVRQRLRPFEPEPDTAVAAVSSPESIDHLLGLGTMNEVVLPRQTDSNTEANQEAPAEANPEPPPQAEASPEDSQELENQEPKGIKSKESPLKKAKFEKPN